MFVHELSPYLRAGYGHGLMRGRKLLERRANGNIMRCMCSREWNSVSLGGLIAGLLVFLAAFLVGVLTVLAV